MLKATWLVDLVKGKPHVVIKAATTFIPMMLFLPAVPLELWVLKECLLLGSSHLPLWTVVKSDNDLDVLNKWLITKHNFGKHFHV